MYLVDTNVWLELLLEQEKAADVRHFLATCDAADLAITEFAVYSIGIVLSRFSKNEVFTDFLADTLERSRMRLIRLDVEGLKRIGEAQQRFRLDFDDAYQYVTAESHSLVLVSFDSDFDRTTLGRKTPAEVGARNESSVR